MDDFDEMDNPNRDSADKLNEVDNDLNTFDDFANTLNMAIDSKDNMAKAKKDNNLTIEIKNSNFKELGDIFDKIDEFDSFFGTISPRQKANEAFKNNKQPGQEKTPENHIDPPAVPLNRRSFGMNKSEIVV